jgi:lipopolysaccharide transport system permease protein
MTGDTVTIGSVYPKSCRRTTIIRPPRFSPLSIFCHVSTLLRYRDLIYTLSVYRIKLRYKQSLLGVSWAIVQPLSLVLAYTVVFSFIARVPSEGVPYALFAYTALLPWTYFATSLTSATQGIVTYAHLVTKVYLPREILVFTYIISALFDFLVASTILLGLLKYYHIPLTVKACYALPILLVLTMFVAATALVLSAVQVHFRDVGIAMPLLLQLWMFATPVVYPLSSVPLRFRHVYMLNPMVGVIDNFRRVVLQGVAPEARSFWMSASFSVVALFISYVYFKYIEVNMADKI